MNTQERQSITLYMNNFKLMGKTEEELQKQIQTEHSVILPIWNSDLRSIQRPYSRKEKSVYSQNLIFCTNNGIQELEQGKPTNT
jgi:hypothetical protein